MCFYFCFCFFSWYSCKYYKLVVGINTCAITTVINKYKSIIKNKIKKHNKIVLLAKTKLNNAEVLIHKALIDSKISHDEFVVINNKLKEYDDMKGKN